MAKRKRASRATWLTIDLPSNNLDYANVGDHEVENHVDYVTVGDDYKYDRDNMQFEMNHPVVVRLDRSKIRDILCDCTDFSAIQARMYEYHTEAFDTMASEDMGLDLGLKHASGDTAEIKLSVAKKLLYKCKCADNFVTLYDVMKEWDAKYFPRHEHEQLVKMTPLTEWEAEPLGWLLMAAMRLGKEVPLKLPKFELAMRKAVGLPTTKWVSERHETTFNEDIFQAVYDNEGEWHAFNDAVDWVEYEKKIAEARREKFDKHDEHDLVNLSAEDHKYLLDNGFMDDWHRARCPLTLELALAA